MSVHDALPGDLYADTQNKIWRVVSICGEPTVTVEEVESDGSARGKIRCSCGVSGLMWNGFKRILRPE